MSTRFDEDEFILLRHRMVETQLRGRGISDELVLQAMERVPRHLFVPPARRHAAYDDEPLPIGRGQTISQPYMVARMTELLRLAPDSRVLEIGTGSGYQAAVLAELTSQVWTVERNHDLARQAEELLAELGYDYIRLISGDGTLGYGEAAPYDGILVTAAAPSVPDALRRQLAPRGRMVIPVTAGYNQDLRLIERLPEPETPSEPSYRETSILGCVFVPLIGEQGYRK